MTRFEMLIRVLDGIRSESGSEYAALYANSSNNEEHIWQARARAYIHLYIKVMFGLRDFRDRESYVTDGSFDGGVDGYYIDTDSKTLLLIQSKLRRSEEGFEGTSITVKELLSMQIKRILSGEEFDECGAKYNDKILQLQSRFEDVLDKHRYSIKIVILANVSNSYSEHDLLKLTDKYKADIFDFNRSYDELLLPVISGNLFRAKDISISLDLSNKGAGSKITYNATVPGFDCDITVVFVPIYEIARLMSDYKNSILKYNPRSYLEIEGDGVNRAVRSTVLNSSGNDFALLNNGITLICDESGVSEQSGKKHKAQLYLLNPQIINGGQTAYTLSRVYEEIEESDREITLSGQEVLVKAIALTPNTSAEICESEKRSLIERISTATNSQTSVSYADRASGEDRRLEAQRTLYRKLGILLELKKGEFGEGIRSGYIDQTSILDRTLFQRLFFVSNERFSSSVRKKIVREDYPTGIESNFEAIDNFHASYIIWNMLASSKNKRAANGYAQALPKVYAAICAMDRREPDIPRRAKKAAKIVERFWHKFLLELSTDGNTYTGVFKTVSRGTEEIHLRAMGKNTHRDLQSRMEVFFSHENIAKLTDREKKERAEKPPTEPIDQ